MAPLRIATAPPDGESAIAALTEDSPAFRKPNRAESRIPLTRWEAAAAAAVFLVFAVGLFCIFLTMPQAEYDKILRLPRNLSDLRVLNNILCFVLLLSFEVDWQASS